jgi:hypothetical protein
MRKKTADISSKTNIQAFWKTIGSVRIALVLLWVIIAVSFIGALLPSEKQPLVYSSIWFFCLLGLFSLNLLVCSTSRIIFNRKKAGSSITHAAVLVILAGALVSVIFGFRGSMELEEGVSSRTFRDGMKQYTLPFAVSLEDFSLEWYPVSQAGYPVRARVENAGFKDKFMAKPGVDYKLGNTGYSFSIIKYLPHFMLDEDNKPVNLSDRPNNPALLIHIATPAGPEDRWIFSKHPDLLMSGDPNIRFRFDLEPQIKEFRSRVKVSDPGRNVMFVRDIKVNTPLEYRGYNFYQSRYDSEGLSWTGLDVVHDPGVKIVFLGFIMLNIGVIVIFYPKLKASLSVNHNKDT